VTSTQLPRPPGETGRNARVAPGFRRMSGNGWRKPFHKNIYTKILFSNLAVFGLSLIAIIAFSGLVVKQVIENQFQQDLLRKAKRINSAWQLAERMWKAESVDVQLRLKLDAESARRDWEKAKRLFRDGIISKAEYKRAETAYQREMAAQNSQQARSRQELLNFLTDLFNARAISIFDRSGNITATSAKPEMEPSGKVEPRFVAALDEGGIAIFRSLERETERPVYVAVLPLTNHPAAENGILLEMRPSTLYFALNRMVLYLIAGGIVVLLVMVFNLVYLAMYISRPISRLTTTVAEISQGNDLVRVEGHPLDEINILAGQLDKLAGRLQKMRAEGKKMEEERAQLFTEISHELRTPLTSVQGFVEAIRDGMVPDPALREKYLDTIHTQTIHIARLVDDILALGRLESGQLAVVKEPLDLIGLAQSVLVSFEAEAARRHTVLSLEKTAESAIVLGDVDRMEQIIRNLLKNAIGAAENGVIRVGVALRPGEVELTVQDNGIGIAAEDLPHIWDRFYRGKNRRGGPAQAKGTGLGLVIVKKLVQLQGGTIEVESQLGAGTTFKMSFPSFDQS
jgi:signal transduction histidine kinase